MPDHSKYLYSVKQTMLSRALVRKQNKSLFDNLLRLSALKHARGAYKEAGQTLKKARRLAGAR